MEQLSNDLIIIHVLVYCVCSTPISSLKMFKIICTEGRVLISRTNRWFRMSQLIETQLIETQLIGGL